jgi:hypothetical protein
MQIFALFISKYDTREEVNESNKLFWLEAAAVFAVQGLS